MAIDRDELIERRAYQLWEAEGRPDGGDLRHWLRASEEVGDASIGEMAAAHDQTPMPKEEATDTAPGETKSKTRRTAKSPCKPGTRLNQEATAPAGQSETGITAEYIHLHLEYQSPRLRKIRT